VLLLSGFCTLGYELLWFRGLRYLVGASSYAFAIALFTFLCGLGSGSLLLRRLARRGTPERDLVLIQIGIAVLALAGISLQAALLSQPRFYEHLSVFVPAVRMSAWGSRLLLDVAVAVVTLLPATILMGLSFPLATRLFLGDAARVDASAGAAYLIANLGSIAGAIGGVLFLLPHVGVVGGTRLLAGANLVAAAGLWLSMPGRGSRLGVLVGATAAVVFLSEAWLPRRLALVGEQVTGSARLEQVFFEEGDLATVQVLQEPEQPARLTMAIDGYKIGWSEGYQGTPYCLKQILIADLPQALEARIATTLSVGLGSGATLAELASRPSLSRLDCVEINAAVVRGQKLFPEARVLADPRTRLYVEDAVHFLLRSRERYDLIVSDGKQDPFFAGNADLLCLEFYRFARARLADHGLLVQWFPLATLPGDLRVVLATLCRSFPNVDAFCFPPHSLLLVAGLEPLSGRAPLPEAEFASLPMAKSLARYGFGSATALRNHWVAGREVLAAAVADEPTSQWDRQILDVSTFKAHGTQWAEANTINLAMLVSLEDRSFISSADAPASTGPRGLESARILRRAWLAVLENRVAQATSLAEDAVRSNPEDPEAQALLRMLRSQPPGGR
jgi:spermidine synthase